MLRCLTLLWQQLEFFLTAADDVLPFDEDYVDLAPPIKRQQHIFPCGRHKEDSAWWIKFLCPEMTLDMETKIEG